MFDDLELVFDRYSHLLAAIAILIAMGGLVVTIVQLERNLRFQRETVAKTTYREYLKLCIERPKLANGTVTKGGLDWDSYTWFVSMLIWTCEEVIAYAPGDAVWLNNIKIELGYHRNYLISPDFGSERSLYTKSMNAIIDEIVASAPSAAGILPPIDKPKYEPPPRRELPKADAPKVDATISDPLKPETKSEPPKFEPFKTETPKT